MALADINKWISGETEVFFGPDNIPPSVAAGSSPGNKRSTAPPSIPKFAYAAIGAVVLAFAFAAFITSMQHPIGPAPTSDAESQPLEGGAAPTSAKATENATWPAPIALPSAVVAPLAAPILTPPTTLSDAQLAASLRTIGNWYDQRSKAAPIPERKPSPPHRTSRRDRPRDPNRALVESGEATRLMVDELRQRGVAVGSARGFGHAE
jgi:hypothetical protein